MLEAVKVESDAEPIDTDLESVLEDQLSWERCISGVGIAMRRRSRDRTYGLHGMVLCVFLGSAVDGAWVLLWDGGNVVGSCRGDWAGGGFGVDSCCDIIDWGDCGGIAVLDDCKGEGLVDGGLDGCAKWRVGRCCLPLRWSHLMGTGLAGKGFAGDLDGSATGGWDGNVAGGGNGGAMGGTGWLGLGLIRCMKDSIDVCVVCYVVCCGRINGARVWL